MEKKLTGAADYTVYASINEVAGQRGMYELKFTTGYAGAKHPDERQTKFQAFLTWSQLKEFKELLP